MERIRDIFIDINHLLSKFCVELKIGLHFLEVVFNAYFLKSFLLAKIW